MAFEKEASAAKMELTKKTSSFADAPDSKNMLTFAVVGGATLVLAYVDKYHLEDIKKWPINAREGLHHWTVPAVAITIYLAMVAFLPLVMRNREPMKFTLVMLVHNYILSMGSLVATIAIAREVAGIAFLSKEPVVDLMCDPHRYHKNTSLHFWYYVFYLSKMYEFIDTAILILRKKPLIFLHVYHHVITLALCWCMLDDQMSLQWISTSANTMIHTFMYFFYACQSIGLDVWWKRYLTMGQIVQFVLGNIGNISWAYFKIGLGKDCSGSWVGFAFGVGVILSFLLLFIDLYSKSYSKPKTAHNGTPSSSVTAAASTAKEE